MSNLSRWKWMLLPLAFCILILAIYMFAFQHGGSDIGLYRYYASCMRDGLVPYKDFAVEYPSIALLLFYLPYLVSHDLAGYNTAFAVEMMLFAMAGVWLLFGLVRQLQTRPWVALSCYALIVIAIGDIAVERFDIVPAIITLAALYAFCRGKYEVAWIVLAVGVMTKVYPAVLVPLFLIYQWQHHGWRRTLSHVVIFALALTLIAGPALWIGRGEFIHSFTVQSGRALQLESLYASLLLLLNSLGLVSAVPVGGPMSFDVSSPLAQPLAKCAFFIVGAALLAVYFMFMRRIRRNLGSPTHIEFGAGATTDILNYSIAAVAVFIATNKVFSPQFILWICPLMPLFSGRWQKVGWMVFLVVAYLTWYVYPMNYFGLADGQQVVTNALVLRNTLMILLIVLLVMSPAHESTASVDLPVLAPAED